MGGQGVGGWMGGSMCVRRDVVYVHLHVCG